MAAVANVTAAALLSQLAIQAAAASSPGNVSWSIRRCAWGEISGMVPIAIRLPSELIRLKRSCRRFEWRHGGPIRPARANPRPRSRSAFRELRGLPLRRLRGRVALAPGGLDH